MLKMSVMVVEIVAKATAVSNGPSLGNHVIALIMMNLNGMVQNVCLYLKRDICIPLKIMILKRNAVTETKPGIKISTV